MNELKGDLYAIRMGPWVEIRVNNSPPKIKRTIATVPSKVRERNPLTNRLRTVKGTTKLEMIVFEGGSILGSLHWRDFIPKTGYNPRKDEAYLIHPNVAPLILKALGRS